MQIDSVMKDYFLEKLKSIPDRPFPGRFQNSVTERSWEDVLGWVVTGAYVFYYFFGAQWGEVGSYLSFSPSLF